MESANGGVSSKGVLAQVSASSEDFKNNVLAPLKSAYLYEESKQSFRYKSAVLIKNPALEKKYDAFRAKRREEGYSEEDLKESYGFLLFDDVNKANALGETGVLAGNSACTTLGDPSKGVYISMYSDCLDQNRWYHGKSGYIAIVRLTKGRVKRVLENYTQNFTAPTEGFDCHVSEQLPSVSSKTSSFLAFERTQYYMYELPDDGSNETALSPSGACPFAIVPFSYTDTKATFVAPQEKSEEKKLVCHYFPWSGQLEIGTHSYDVGLRSTAGALIPAELPPVVKVDRAISMLDLRQLLPRTVFETCLSGEVFLDGLHCSLYEMVSSEAEETSSLSLLLWEIKEKDVALIVPLNDGGFLILLHSSHFLTYDDSGSSAAEVLQGMFVFPESRVIYRGTKGGQRKPALSSDILRVLPVLSYAEGEVEKTPIDPSEELCEAFAQHMQSYAALINPGLALSPSRDISIFPDQYDVPDAHKHLYSSPEWNNRAWQSFRSYLSKPDSFQLPVSKASEILAAGQQERIEDLDDDVYFCLSSPEEVPANHVSMGSEDQLTDQKYGVNDDTSVDSSITSAEAQVDLTAVSQNAVPDDLQAGNATKDTGKSDLPVLIKADMGTKDSLTPSTSEDLPAELIVSITSAERTLTAKSVISTESADETVKTKEVFDCSEVTNLTKTNGRKLHKEHSKGQKHVSKACDETPSLTTVTVNMQVEDDNLKSQKEDQAKVSSGHPQLSNPSNIDWRKVRRRKRIFGKLSAKNKKVKSAIIDLAVAEKKKSDPGQQSFKSTIVMELDPCPLRKKTERWDLKPVISTCGRILVPHGYVDIADQIKTLKDKSLSTKDEQCPEKMLVDDHVNAEDQVKAEKESSTALETAVDKTEATTSMGEGNHPQNVDVSNVSPEHSILRQSEDVSGSLTLNSKNSEHYSKNDGIKTPLKTVQEKHTDTPSSGKCAAKGEFLLSKLKSVLLRGKRKTSIIVSEETTADTAQDTLPCLKKGKVDSDSGTLKSNEAINPSVQEVSKTVSVDPLFAFALGLTPRETPDKIQKSQGQDTQQRKDSSETQEQTILDKQPQIIQRPPSIFPRRSRIKTLKKHQGVSAEHVRKKWWLHFQTPACFASEKLKYKECTRDNSVRKTVKEKSSSACSSTDALNLLADLALSASNDQVPPQPEPALEREPETSLKECDLTITSAEKESVLHALLRQPAARPIQPHESPSPSHLVGGRELVGLVSKEHAYSLPPSSSLLLGLSGTPFQVSPLSGSTRLLHHHQTMYGDGIKTLHPCVDQEDGSEHNRLKKHMVRLRKFRHSRTFVNKDGSIQVTRQWKENYDFNLDSKFTCDSKDKAIIRALHGPWDYTIQDTNEEVRLIVHMWIGLFYSRSTARFFHVDSNSSEESDSLEKSHGMMSAPAQTEFKADPFAPFQNVTDTTDTLISKALDLSKKKYSVLDQGSVILDLSLRNSNAEIIASDPQVNKKKTFVSEQKEAGDTLNSLKSSMDPQNASTFQCYRKNEHATESINEMNVRSATANKRTCTLLQKVGRLEHTDVPPFKGGGVFISVQEDMENVSGQPGNHQTASGIGHVLHGCNNEKTDMKDGIENSQAKEMSLVQKQGWDSLKPVTDKDSNKKASDVVHVTEPDEIVSKDGENKEVKEKPYREGAMKLSQKIIHIGDESTNKEPVLVCNGNILENEMQSSREEPKSVSSDMTENVNEDVDCFTVHKGKVIEDDHFGLDRKDCCISDVEDHSDLNNQPLPMSDGPNSVKEDCVTECSRKAPLDEHPSKVDNKEDAPHDLQLRTQCANGSTLTEENVISEKAPPGMEPIHNEPAVEENPENGICLADLNIQPLPMSDCQDSAKEDCVTECNLKAPLDKQPAQADNKEDAPHDLQLRTQCANGSELTEENAISENAPSGMKPVHNEPTVEENPENAICLADLNDHQLPMMSDGPDTVKDCITECNRKAPLDEPQADNEEHACHDVELIKLCGNGSALTDEHTISEKTPHTQSEIYNETVAEENSENGICLADIITLHYQKVALPTSDERTCSLDGSSDDGSIPQINDSVETGSPNKVMANFSLCSADHEDRDAKSVEENPEKGICLADLNNQPLPMMCDGPDSVNDCVTECNLKAPLDKQPSQADNKEDPPHDLQLRTQCANGSELTEENTISEKTPHTQSEIYNETVAEENSENGICLADIITLHYQKVTLPTSDERTCSLDGSSADGSIPQINDSVETGSPNKVMANFSLCSADHEDRDAKSVEENPEKGICLADLNNQPFPMMCDGPDSVNDCVTECNLKAPLDKQPSQADNKEDPPHDLQLRTQCANGSELTEENTISEKTPHTQSEIYNETVAEENSENGICLADIITLHYQKVALPTSDERTCSLDGSSADGSIPQINDSVETGSPNKVMANFSLCSADHEDRDAKSVEEESHLPECKGVTKYEAEVALPKEMTLKSDTINKGLEKIHSRVVIPFIGIDTCGEDAVQPHDSHSECKVEEFQGQKGIPFISDTIYPETVLPTEICSTSQLYSKNSELFDGKISLKLLDVSETNQPEVSGSESDDRCPTPTMDEKPYQYVACSGHSSSSVFSGSKTGKNMTQKCLGRSSAFLKDKMPLEQKHKSNSDPNLHYGLHPDLELRTLRVLQSIDKFLFKSSHTDNASQIKTGDVRHTLDQIPNTSSKYFPTCLTPSHIFADFKGKKISNTKSVVVSACTSQELQTESSGLKRKLDEETSVGQDICHPQRYFSSIDCLQAIKPNVDQERHKTTLQTNLSHEPRSFSQRPVMAVKPSKSDEVQGDCISKDRESENSLMSIFSKDKPTKSPVVPYTTPAPVLLKKKTESLEGNSEGLDDSQQEASELYNSDLSKFGVQDPSYKGRDIPSSFLPMQSFEYAKTSSKLVVQNQIFLTKSFDGKVGQMAKESIEMDQNDCSGPSASVVDYKDDSTIDDNSLFLGPESSLTCTVYNTGQGRCYSFLEQLSQRCLQDDLTQASMEQECLIFSQQMEQLLKRSKRGPVHQLDEHDKLNLSCSSPVTVHFSSLEEQEDSVDHLDVPSLIGQKIKVDMSDSKNRADTAVEGNALHPQNLSEGTGNQMENAGVSGLTAEYARQYTAMMNDVCAVKKVPSRPKHFRMDRRYSKTEQSNHFDFCGQMKREMDESFRNSLNSVVKKSCKTKYRFYILVTSDDAFFEETKAQLEAEGHTAVQPSDFFLGDDSSSSLLIILKNEDIAEHICEVPHLLELKKSPSVQFAGIDEPDDVVNLTHQELFMRGGFIMFDRAALESLSLCNMKKMAEILQDLSRTGKWKWMLHYRDSRRLKENARLSAEAKEKKHFINLCQEVGILEALPYHECDLMSRDLPDYLTCLVRLQVQNISARYPIFITDTTADIAFGTNGILTMNFNSFLTCSPSETFTA